MVHLTIEPPPCPVHETPGAEAVRVAEVPDGFICLIAPPPAFDDFAGNAHSCKLVRPVPPEHPVQLKLALACVDDGTWEGGAIEPLSGGAFVMRGGYIIERDANWHVCLLNPDSDEHTLLLNWMLPCLN
jgi:hypothetical protein